jgi:hypothetical protein
MVSLPVFGGFLYGLFRKRQWESLDELHLISQPSRIDAATGASPVGSGFASLSDLKSKVPCGKINLCSKTILMMKKYWKPFVYVKPVESIPLFYGLIKIQLE